MNSFDDKDGIIKTLGSEYISNYNETEKIEIKKTISKIMSESRKSAKEEYCLYCGEQAKSFCNSHSIPAFILKNIAANGDVYVNNKLIKVSISDDQKGVKNSGTFNIICNDCDSKIFSNYENPNNYKDKPTNRMLAQIAMKNYLMNIGKRKQEIQFYDLIYKQFELPKELIEQKQKNNNSDLKEFTDGYNLSKRSSDKEHNNNYYMFFCEKLDYIVPIAFQNTIVLPVDLKGGLINDVHHSSKHYKLQGVHICIFPLEEFSMVFLFIESKNRRYRPFYKQLKQLPLNDQLAVINYMIFCYSEDVFISKNIDNTVLENENLIQISRKTTEVLGVSDNTDTHKVIKDNFDFSERHSVPNLLSKHYKLKE